MLNMLNAVCYKVLRAWHCFGMCQHANWWISTAKVALKLVAARKKSRVRVKCGGQTFAPFGMRTDVSEEPAMTKDFTPYKTDDLPQKVDLRKYMSPVEDQSQCNSCCANAAAGAYEYINRKHCQETGDVPGDISRLFIYYVGRKKDMAMWGERKTAAPKDEGMSLSGALSAMQMSGACLAPSWPYDLGKLNEKPTDECFKEASQYKVCGVEKVPVDIDMMRRCLAEGNPIIFGLMLTDKFFRPGPSAYITTPGRNDKRAAQHGCHAMLIVGYNDRQQVFIVRNSWGENWGEKGYCYLGYDYAGNPDFNICQQFAITKLSKVDFTPDADDGEDFDIQDDAVDNVIVEEEEPEEPDAEDDFDWSEKFKGDTLVKQFFADHDGVMNVHLFSLALSLYNKGEGGDTFDWLQADLYVNNPDNFPPDKLFWTPQDFSDIVMKFQKKSDAELYPNLAFLFKWTWRHAIMLPSWFGSLRCFWSKGSSVLGLYNVHVLDLSCCKVMPKCIHSVEPPPEPCITAWCTADFTTSTPKSAGKNATTHSAKLFAFASTATYCTCTFALAPSCYCCHRTCAWRIAHVFPNSGCRSYAGCVHSRDSDRARGAVCNGHIGWAHFSSCWLLTAFSTCFMFFPQMPSAGVLFPQDLSWTSLAKQWEKMLAYAGVFRASLATADPQFDNASKHQS